MNTQSTQKERGYGPKDSLLCDSAEWDSRSGTTPCLVIIRKVGAWLRVEGVGCRKLSRDTRTQPARVTGILHTLLVTPWHGWMNLSECLELNLYKWLFMLCMYVCIHMHISANVFWVPSSISQLPSPVEPPTSSLLSSPSPVSFLLPSHHTYFITLSTSQFPYDLFLPS